MKNFVTKIAKVEVDNLSLSDALKYILKGRQTITFSSPKTFPILNIVTINPEFVVIANEDQRFQKLINSAFLRVPDGVGILWAAAIKGQPLKEKVSGLRLLESLAKRAAEQALTIGLIGGRGQVAVRSLECLKGKYPRLQGWAMSGPEVKIQKYPARLPIVIKGEVPAAEILKTDILFVAMGAPKQEFFIESLRKLPFKKPLVAMGVGGAFDEISGKTKKTPEWLENLGLKWFWRLVQEPWRWRRQLRLLKFIQLVLTA